MKFKIDGNLPVEVCDVLRTNGHDAVTVHDEQLTGKHDTDIANISTSEGRALITLDTDFADIRAFPPSEYQGIVVFRLVFTEQTSRLATHARDTFIVCDRATRDC